METYPITDEVTRTIIAFEIENAYVGPGLVSNILSTVNGVSDVRRRRLFRNGSDIHVEFRYRKRDCVVAEPFGDNSRYWVGPYEIIDELVDLDDIEKAFKSYRLPFLRRLIGDFLTLRPLWQLIRK